MIEMSATVHNRAGIHCRPSAAIVEKVRNYEGVASVRRGRAECDLRSVLDLMTLGLEKGARVHVRVSGRDEESVCRMLVELFETRFDFPPRSTS